MSPMAFCLMNVPFAAPKKNSLCPSINNWGSVIALCFRIGMR